MLDRRMKDLNVGGTGMYERRCMRAGGGRTTYRVLRLRNNHLHGDDDHTGGRYQPTKGGIVTYHCT